MTVLLVGAGRMGSALLKGWLACGEQKVVVVEPSPSAALRKHAAAGRITLLATPSQVKAKKIGACVVAIKPQILKGEAVTLADIAANGVLMISIAAGISVATLRNAWGPKARVVRAMPNTPGAIGHGITGLYAAKNVGTADRKRAKKLLSVLGETVWVGREELIDCVTAVSGSGPAYVFLMVEALAAAGASVGLAPVLAEKLARGTVVGAGALLGAEKMSAAALREAVTSPGGTTEAALKILMPELRDLMERAVAAAKKRAQELG